MKTVLFQGDSITDVGRNREDFYALGGGYANLVASHLGYEFPNDYEFINRGVSGNRIVDVYARIKDDIINLKPDYMSLLIGVNDVWHEVTRKNGVDAQKFEKIYTMLLEEVLNELPDIKIMILEPYVLKGPATEDCDECPNKWEIFDQEVKERAKVAKRIAEKFGFVFVPLQERFDSSSAITNNTSHWTPDGVHPTNAGHELIKRGWLEGLKKLN